MRGQRLPASQPDVGASRNQAGDELLQAKAGCLDEVVGVCLSAVVWEEADWTGARFRECTMERSSVGGANLTDATFIDCRFVECRFSHTVLRNARFESCNFAGGDENPGCTFAFADLCEAYFLRCDLSTCRFQRADMFSITLDECRLQGAVFDQVDFARRYSRKVVTNRATFRSCKMNLVEMECCRLSECEVIDCDLREANLREADLTGTDLRDCGLHGADLTHAKLDGANLRGADVGALNLLSAASFLRVKVSQSQQFALLEAMGVSVHPDECRTL